MEMRRARLLSGRPTVHCRASFYILSQHGICWVRSKTHKLLFWKAVSNSHKVLDRPRKSSHPFRPFLTFRQVSGRVLEYLPPAGCSLGAAIQDVGATAHPRASLEPCTYGLPIGSVAFATVIPGLEAAIADPSAVPRSAPAPRQRACCKLWYKPTGCTMDRRFSRSTRTFSIMGSLRTGDDKVGRHA